MTTDPAGSELLTLSEVARLFGVDTKTVARWAKDGKLPSIRTLGGHRRFRATDVQKLLAGDGQEEPGAEG